MGASPCHPSLPLGLAWVPDTGQEPVICIQSRGLDWSLNGTRSGTFPLQCVTLGKLVSTYLGSHTCNWKWKWAPPHRLIANLNKIISAKCLALCLVHCKSSVIVIFNNYMTMWKDGNQEQGLWGHCAVVTSWLCLLLHIFMRMLWLFVQDPCPASCQMEVSPSRTTKWNILYNT